MKFKSSSPAEIVWQVLGRDAVEAIHPLLQTRIVSIDVLDMEDVLLNPDTCGDVDRFVSNGSVFRHGPIRGRPIRTKNSLGRQQLQKQATERFLVGTGKHRVEMFALPILRHKDRNLLIGQPTFSRMPAAMTRWTRQVTLPFVRQKKVRLIGFDQG